MHLDPNDLIPGLDVQLTDLEEHETELAPSVHRVDLRSLDVSWTFDPRALLDMFDVGQLTDGQMTRDDLLEAMGDPDTTNGSFDERDLQIDGGVLWALGGLPAFQVRAWDAASGRGLLSSALIPGRSSLSLARSGSRAFVAGVAGPGFGTFAVTALDTSVPAEIRVIAPGARRLTTTR